MTISTDERNDAIYVLARSLLYSIVAKEIENGNLWELCGDEIGEYDWEDVETKTLRLARSFKQPADKYREAYDLLKTEAARWNEGEPGL